MKKQAPQYGLALISLSPLQGSQRKAQYLVLLQSAPKIPIVIILHPNIDQKTLDDFIRDQLIQHCSCINRQRRIHIFTLNKLWKTYNYMFNCNTVLLGSWKSIDKELIIFSWFNCFSNQFDCHFWRNKCSFQDCVMNHGAEIISKHQCKQKR